MNQKSDFLSIGEMSKLTGAGIQALRYYERKNILKPAYTDPDSGYRYYSYEQLYFVQKIINCVNLDIPLI
jgi:DNA-binding transcriptional MerR regulator